MKVNVLVNCQYFENYNVGPDGFNTFGDKQPHWKPKGGHQFTMEVETDVVMYTDDLEGKLTEIVKEQSNDLEKVEYRDHEVLFQEPTELSYDLLMKKIDNEEMAV